MAVTRRCTATPMAVYIGVSGDHPKPATLGPSLLDPGGHRPRGGGATEQGVAVPLRHQTPSPSCKFFRVSFHDNLEQLSASDANSQSVFSKHIRIKLAFLNSFSINFLLALRCALGLNAMHEVQHLVALDDRIV